MRTRIISKTFDEVIEKHGEFYSSLTKPLKELTDSKEEYKMLKEGIWELRQYTKDLPIEFNKAMTYQGKWLSGSAGTEDSVEPSHETIYTGVLEGLQINGHNHPDYRSCFQSYDDMRTQIFLNEKYSFTIGTDGVFIIKNPNNNTIKTNEINDFDNTNGATFDNCKALIKTQEKKADNGEYKILSDLERYNHNMKEEFKKTHEKEIQQIMENSIINDDVDFNKYFTETDKLFQNYATENINKLTQELNNTIQPHGMNAIYINTKKRKIK